MSALSEFIGAPAAKPTSTSAISKFVSEPASKPAAVTSFINSPAGYKPFEGQGSGGAFLGISTSTDPYSGRPYFAYKLPGEATTTDTTRTAPTVNPEVATTTPRATFTNERMPESASQAMRQEQGATKDQQLDHRMALSLGGSNADENLKLIPTSENQAAGNKEGELSSAVAAGKMSLFDAQRQEATNKGLPLPFTDNEIQKQVQKDPNWWSKIISGTEHVAKTALVDLFNTVAQSGPVERAQALLQSIKTGDPKPLADSFQKQFAEMGQKVNMSTGQPQNMDYVDPKKQAMFISQGLLSFIQGVAGHGENIGPEPTGYVAPKELTPEEKVATVNKLSTPDIVAAREHTANTPATGEINTPERNELRDKIINETYGSGATNKDHRADIVIGPPASGKTSSVVDNLIKEHGSIAPDADQIKAQLPEYGNGIGAQVVHKESTIITKFIHDHAMENGDNLVIQTIGDNLENLNSKIDQLKAKGYDVHLHLNELSPELAANRAVERYSKGGHFVDPDYIINKVGLNPSHNYDILKNDERISTAEKLSNAVQRGNPPTRVESRGLQSDGHGGGERKENGASQRGTQKNLGGTEKTEQVKRGPRKYGDLEAARTRANPLNKLESTNVLVEMAKASKSPNDFYISLSGDEQRRVLDAIDPNRLTHTPEEAAHAFYSYAKEHIAPRDSELPSRKQSGGTSKDQGAKHISEIKPSQRGTEKSAEEGKKTGSVESPYTNEIIANNNGGVKPPENKGGMTPPPIDFSSGKDIAAIRLSTDTMERNIEKIFPKETAEKLNKWLVEPVRKNETDRVRYVKKLRTEIKTEIVDKFGIRAGTVKSALVQRFGEGRISLDELKKAAPKDWQNIVEASKFFRKKYDGLLSQWNKARIKAGLNPIATRANYFRHFIDLSSFAKTFGFDFRQSNLPTAISGITEFFRSQTPWASAAMRRLGNTTTDDAVGGMDNYLDSASRAVFHTDSVQRGRLVEKYLREAATANENAGIDAREGIKDAQGKETEPPPPIKLPNFASNLNDWTNLVSGKQARLDRAVESVLGRPALAFMRAMTRQFGLNVIGGNISSAVTHAIPMSYTLATVDKGAAFKGAIDVLRSPFLQDFSQIDGVESSFLTRRFGKDEIEKTLGEKVATGLSAPFHWVDQFISRFAVAAKYNEGLSKGLSSKEAMAAADNYAGRVIGDRSTGNLPNLMNTRTLGWLTQFQIEVNDNIKVLIHDIPKWEQGNAYKIANRFAQFALYSFLFNQTMQTIKGSGKGLDPIDLGLTLAGINDEGHDKTLMQRLQAAGGDLLKELPFSSIPTGGQIPALQPISQAYTTATSGKPLDALKQLLVSFASPVGGGSQLNKTLTGIQAWRQGYVTDSSGKIVSTVPSTIPALAQGALFGPNAFSDVKKSKSEISNLDATITQQQAASKLKTTQARNIWSQLQGMPAEQAKGQLLQIAQQDPDMAKRILSVAKESAAGITKTDTLVKSLGVSNGERAKYIVGQLQSMKTDDEKKQYLLDLANKKLLTADVLKQVTESMGSQ